MPISAHMKKTHWKWGHCDSLVGWLRHIFQMDHGVSIFAPANRYPDAKSSIVHYSMAIYDFWHLVSRNFGWWPNVLFFLGNVRCYFNRKTKMLWLLMIINILIFAKFLHTRKGTQIFAENVSPKMYFIPSEIQPHMNSPTNIFASDSSKQQLSIDYGFNQQYSMLYSLQLGLRGLLTSGTQKLLKN